MHTGVGTVQVSWLQQEEEEDARSLLPKCPSDRPLSVLQFSRHSLGDATAQQPDQEEATHAQCDHEQDVVFGWRGYYLHGEVREAICWHHLQVT